MRRGDCGALMGRIGALIKQVSRNLILFYHQNQKRASRDTESVLTSTFSTFGTVSKEMSPMSAIMLARADEDTVTRVL